MKIPAARMGQHRRRWIAAAVLLVALVLWGRGGWLYAKAGLAQVLLARAWDRTVEGQGAVELVPWPWADTYPVARLEAPRLGVRRIVLAGSSGRTLAFGPGHVPGTALPGEPGHAAIGGHRDTHLAFLQRLRPGDELVVETRRGELRRYRVDHREVVDYRDTGVLVDTGEARLSLITCYPFDAVVPGGPLRYVVSAVEIADGEPAVGSFREIARARAPGRRWSNPGLPECPPPERQPALPESRCRG